MGKDLIASVIHRHSHRQGFPFVKVGCTLFPPQLIESELYGHEKGSFTGAEQKRKGRFDLAEGGTLYLDDVDDIPLEQQSKLLRAIEEKVFERVGGTTPIKADVRIVASTKRNLLEKIAEGTFRQDLYYRLDVLRINIPPLRERLEDMPALAEHLLERIAKDRPFTLEPEALEAARSTTTGRATSASCYHTLERAYLVGAGQHHGRPAGPGRAGRRPADRRRRTQPAQRRFPGGHGPGRTAAPGKRPARLRGQQDRGRRRAGHEALDLPRQAGQARTGIGGGRWHFEPDARSGKTSGSSRQCGEGPQAGLEINGEGGGG